MRICMNYRILNVDEGKGKEKARGEDGVKVAEGKASLRTGKTMAMKLSGRRTLCTTPWRI